MTPDIRAYFDGQFEMFATQGWKDFVAEAQEVVDNAHLLIAECADARQLGAVQAGLRLRLDILGREAAVEAAYNDATAEEV